MSGSVAPGRLRDDVDTERPVTLAVTSSTGVMSIALGRGVADAVEIDVPTERRHAEEMSPRLQEALARAGMAFGDVERLAVDVGPGRFTGLRVGLATVRALAYALDLPVVGLSSLQILAAGALSDTGEWPDEPVTAVIDARRAEVFQQTFVGGEPVAGPAVGQPEELNASAAGLVLGDGADRYAEHYDRSGLHHRRDRNPRAASMLVLAGTSAGVTGTAITPLYLRDPDAKPNIKTRPVASPAS
ncbi:MAG: tRNA (adenosine(37)-N6)-threonylcarbamoyltransferase complex dimerization subunit type 1 TsaB [Actinomycetota bacterium]